MANSDDEDRFLYGSEDEDQPATKKQKVNQEVIDTNSGKVDEKEKIEDNEEELEEESSDDDIDIIIGDNQAKKTTSNQVPGNDILSEVADPESEIQDKANQRSTVTENSSTIDINTNPEYEGKPLTQLDIETLKLKPWRAPGANISDYFNFGFDEITWTAYCHKQDKLRGEFNPQKVMANIMKGPGQLPSSSIQQSGNTTYKPINNKNNSTMPIPPQFQNMSFNFGKMPSNMPQFPMGNLPPGMSYPPPPPPPHQNSQNQRR